MYLYIRDGQSTLAFEWDEHKRQATLRARGLDFVRAARVFEADTLVREDVRRAYGERRFIAIGAVEGDVLTVVYTDRVVPSVRGARVRRIISARPANRRERTQYEATMGPSRGGSAAARPQ